MAITVAKSRKKNVFGQRLRDLREAKGLSVAQLAEASGIAHQTLNKYERGDNVPNWETVEKLADALGVATDAFREQE